MSEIKSYNKTRYGKPKGFNKDLDKEIPNRVTYSFVVCNQNWKIIEAYNRMLSNEGSDIERNKLL